MKPVIGVTPDFEEGKEKAEAHYFLRERYITAVIKGGGVPLILPYVEGPAEVSLLLDLVHGLLLTGGAFDIDPSFYGEEWTGEKGTVKENRTRFEMEITKQALKRGLPILGICGGEQTINVALNGSLYQDIGTQKHGALDHEQKKPKTEPSHQVRIVPETLLHKIIGEETLQVNSAHHQAVKEIGNGLKVNAEAEDGVIEGIESERRGFVLGVQWHPEFLFERDRGCRRIFEAFIDEAARR
ncbi:MAG: gamma-glutamyl-gamma-aminobutyrate hydrolase [Nitrospirae bacterium CG17_big_fil_post_rev_8_21_14_2_50_50_9]|nr:MAG: gamma-glutamyl-gamma-aminobutyrate hydrolase [Nitrospirae bacterium CG17_big_fil_post_rev_8_21_14_2_50_50_9]